MVDTPEIYEEYEDAAITGIVGIMPKHIVKTNTIESNRFLIFLS